jgi:hypothetical protein
MASVPILIGKCAISMSYCNHGLIYLLSQEETAKQETTKKDADTESVDGKHNAEYMTL